MSTRTRRIFIDCGEFKVQADYTPERPAPFCNNHDSPAFSDPGDPMDLEIIEVLTPTGDDLTPIIDALGVWDKVQSFAEDCLSRDIDEGKLEDDYDPE